MKKSALLCAALCLVAGVAAAQAGWEAGAGFGPSFATSGDSPISFNTFGDDVDTGWSLNGYVAGPISGMFGFRGDLGYDSLPLDADLAGDRASGDYKLFRFMGGVQIAPWYSQGRGRPYGFFTVGLVHQSVSATLDQDGFEVDLDFDGESAFGMSVGGGYNYLIGETWGVGGDVHLNWGFFDDDTRMWITPTAQVFFNW